MVLDTLMQRAGGRGNVTPKQIAHITVLTHTEKIELLNGLKQEATELGDKAEFSAEEIDKAIAEVRIASQTGDGTHSVIET